MDYINTETRAVISSTDLRRVVLCSFPDGAELPGYSPIMPADAPDAEPGHRVVASDPVEVDGQWQYGWAQVELTSDELAAQAAPAVPASVPMLNARLALIAAGLSSVVDEHIASMTGTAGEESRAYWNFALNVRRDHPLVIALGAVLNKTPAELDQLFIDAAALDAEAAAVRATIE